VAQSNHTEDPQILEATVQNLVAMATWRLEFVHRLKKENQN
jgi:hypothetical protein